MRYEQIILIGTGRLLLNIVHLLQDLPIPFRVFENSTFIPASFPQSRNRADGRFQRFTPDLLDGVRESGLNTLIISADNMYLFPSSFLNSKNIKILNFHNALLPRHRGVFPQAWSIFEQEKETGVTWHWVDAGIDTGDIVAQRSMPIPDDITSIALIKLQTQLAFEVFKDLLPAILNGTASGRPQPKDVSPELHLSKYPPNNGILDPQWPIDKIWAFLRAMDYGPLYLQGHPKILFEDTWYHWKFYKKIISSEKESEGKLVYMDNGNLYIKDAIILCKVSPVIPNEDTSIGLKLAHVRRSQ